MGKGTPRSSSIEPPIDYPDESEPVSRRPAGSNTFGASGSRLLLTTLTPNPEVFKVRVSTVNL